MPRKAERNSSFISITILVMLHIAALAPAFADPVLLSDQMIAGITGKAIITNIESPSTADVPQLDVDPAFWGDTDGFDAARDPGYVLASLPYQDFQWNEYKYSFPNIRSADAFKTALANRTGITPTGTTIIKTDPDADAILLDDGTAPKVEEVIVTTDRQVGPYLVHEFDGTVIAEKVRFELTFDDNPCSGYEKNQTSYIKKVDGTFGLPYRAYSYSHSGIGPENSYQIQRTRYGAVFMENGTTGASPLTITTSSGTKVPIVPANTSYIVNRLSADIRVHCPQLGLSIGLAPAGEPYPQRLALAGQAHYPDMNRYKELGYLDIKDLDIHMNGCVPIYLYPNQD